MSQKQIIKPIVLILLALVLGAFVYPGPVKSKLNWWPNLPFRLGLDLVGGTHLVYEADLREVVGDKTESMEGIRDVIERRVNVFGVSEPIVQVEGENRLVVELAGVSDVSEAIKLIGETPFLEFKEELSIAEGENILSQLGSIEGLDQSLLTQDIVCGATDLSLLSFIILEKGVDPCYKTTELTGRYLDDASVVFDQSGLSGVGPQVSLTFDKAGGGLFAELTRGNVGRRIAIYLDGLPISAPVVQDEIEDGRAVISGNFTPDEAKQLGLRLNSGALPVPIELISQQTIGASLGRESLNKSLKAGLYGLVLVAIFMILFYRLPGVTAVVALVIYLIVTLAIYKTIPVTLTLAGIAGFILSLGIAVDANILIFARMREELAEGKSLQYSVSEGFHRAWSSIRDSHVTTILGALILYGFTTSFIKGFALTLAIGVFMSLFTATMVTRAFLELFVNKKFENWKWLFK
ncbi:MAG: protein translocase subunit SecD [Candidatus Yanofskybacteria bacterium CG10_big_fil_rev_8_21_14_0_10_36_16]|uniref:Protein translocase subunit SecD n=1 Tax=Candidatus Yanofskybacteria bacterium CG10_big_fil_rev_8_21_14_0_10_36_16 TaxID=1975096 RepID=A0A2J0Q838_9BACT|nr:MAG: protein translocase subunit SecD [Candidatus Yanofskybacteria bacterium CG10_big_fil_rev_8_21_14_0_10_36_16]